MSIQPTRTLGVLTSGGDAPGMNAAVRAVVRTALHHGLHVYAIYEGYQGMIDGGEHIRPMTWEAVTGILHQGGTVIGSARCAAFRTREGRLQAARNLLKHNIDNLVVIGGDGSLTGANLFRQEWPGLLAELVEQGQISKAMAKRHPQLTIVGLVGSIDNDMFGTAMTIGADSALHRITQAVDLISSTAASHQRTFVVEVMGRRCGYLALMGALAAGADWVIIPESPPTGNDWEEKMCEALKNGRAMGRRDSIVLVAEGVHDQHGQAITGDTIKKVLEERLGEDVRVTVLGHMQRGGSPSAYDRYLATLLGHGAVIEILTATPTSEPQLLGIQGNRVVRSPLMACVEQTQAMTTLIAERAYTKAMELRSPDFQEAFHTLRTLAQTGPRSPNPHQQRLPQPLRLAVVNAGKLAPGMNTAVRVATRLGIDQGHTMLGVKNGFPGLIQGEIAPLDWMSVAGWASRGGSELGTSRKAPGSGDYYAIARQIEEQQIQGLLVIGDWTGYKTAYHMFMKRADFPAFDIPIICLPASINNDLPGTELSIGADTAVNNILEAIDKLKQSAGAERRCFIVEVMGRYCGYLALMGGLVTGAEQIYLHEEGVTLANLQADLAYLMEAFERGKRLGLMVRNENADQFYTTEFICSLFEKENGGLFDVRQTILGHLQQGGNPSPLDRIQATRLAKRSLEFLVEEAEKIQSEPAAAGAALIGLQAGQVQISDLADLPRLSDLELQRPQTQWWLALQSITKIMAQPGLPA